MNIIFKEMPTGFIKAKVTEIHEKEGKYGLYLQIIFNVIEKGELANYRFSAMIKPTPLKNSKFYRWITNIMLKTPNDDFHTEDLIGKKCLINIAKQNKYYSVIDVDPAIEYLEKI
jgi:hypothetical protein